MRVLLILTTILLLSACGAGQFGTSYRSYMDPRLSADVVPLAEEQKPILIRSNDLNKDVKLYREHNYIVVGDFDIVSDKVTEKGKISFIVTSFFCLFPVIT